MTGRQADTTAADRAEKAVLWITVGATVAALALSYRNQYDFATIHGAYGKVSGLLFPLIIDVFVVVGELRLFSAAIRRDGWRIKTWGWALTLAGLAASVAAGAAHTGLAWPPTAPMLAAAVAPLAAAACLGTGLGIVKRNAGSAPTGGQENASATEGAAADSATVSRSRARQPGTGHEELIALVRQDAADGLPTGRVAIMARHGVSEHQARVAAKAASNGTG